MSDIFRPLFRSVEDKVANRREQLRKAQRTFRERRDQYLRVLEKSVRRLQANEARLQAEVDRLERDLAAANSKLAQCEAELHKSASLTHTEHAYANRGGYATGLGGFNFASEMGNSARPAYLSSPNGWMESGAGASVSSSSSSTLVWIETENGQPVQMHVQQKQEFGFLPPSAGKNSASLGRDRSATTVLVAHLDAVVVAMEFVLNVGGTSVLLSVSIIFIASLVILFITAQIDVVYKHQQIRLTTLTPKFDSLSFLLYRSYVARPKSDPRATA
ncbi:hypothetical protein AYO21_11371 [Fonsecaea monophora]|uniref:BZIP domain-containing protein n=1 Tax=Fonsecaea monophora TaxID=254056 RepID=A0A177ETR8_9EURO|nr:hypothetical protein AYO21_11371 [Fonsecaea monophora]OAG34462.1 hypothetical protein AYO21_11371 [Fonsecaea monophora]